MINVKAGDTSQAHMFYTKGLNTLFAFGMSTILLFFVAGFIILLPLREPR